MLSQVDAVDYSRAMIDGLVAKLATRPSHAAQISPHVMDCTSLPQEWTGVFDAAFGNLCLMFLPEEARVTALREVARCLAPGGMAVFTTWGPQKDNSGIVVMQEALEHAMQVKWYTWGFKRVVTL